MIELKTFIKSDKKIIRQFYNYGNVRKIPLKKVNRRTMCVFYGYENMKKKSFKTSEKNSVRDLQL